MILGEANRFSQFLKVVLVLLGTSLTLPAQEPRIVSVDYEVAGSEPPPKLWFSCISQFGQIWQTEDEARVCLKQILNSGYFSQGAVVRQAVGEKEIALLFRLSAPSLRVTKLEVEAKNVDRTSLKNWIAQSTPSLGLGDVYTWSAQRRMEIRIEEWFKARGRKVGISSRVHLDYHRGKARLIFKLSEGPSVAAEQPPIRSTDECEKIVKGLNWTGWDDFVPIDLVRRLTTTRGAGCFRQDWIELDLRKLRESGAFAAVNYDITHSGKQYQIGLRIQGKALHIHQVQVRSFGLLKKMPEKELPPLLVKPGDVYQQSRIAETRRRLEERFSQKRLRVEVFEEVFQISKQALGVRFNIFVFDKDKVYVNDRLWKDSSNP